jgi:signal transduction histidine kinase
MNAPNGPVARRLRAIEVFSDLRDEELAFLAELATVVELEPGGVLRSRGDPADVMFAVLDGEMRSRLEEGDSDGRLFVRRPGQVGAMLPHSRLTHFPGTIRAAVRTTLACFAKADFPAMLERIPVLEQRLASVMADRVRETTHFELHRERLAGLGKLAAGLAHELNNPISAIQRAAAEMGRSTEDLAEVARELLRAAVGDAVLQRVETLGAGADGRPDGIGGRPTAAGDRLADGDAEDAVAATLEAIGVERPWLLAADLVAGGVRADALARAVEGVDPAMAGRLLRWREAARSAEAVRRELAAAADRVVGLVAAVKGFSQLDRAQASAELDVRDGLADTLQLMAHALRDRRVTVRVDHAPTLPRVRGVEAQLNQVWLNLIDNAVDAARAGGTVTLRTRAHETEVLIDVEDDGHGIPEAIVWRVFEPFFTTKPVGEGTGLGLELVRRVVMEHGGDVHVESAPGRTVFQVRLPAVAVDQG